MITISSSLRKSNKVCLSQMIVFDRDTWFDPTRKQCINRFSPSEHMTILERVGLRKPILVRPIEY